MSHAPPARQALGVCTYRVKNAQAAGLPRTPAGHGSSPGGDAGADGRHRPAGAVIAPPLQSGRRLGGFGQIPVMAGQERLELETTVCCHHSTGGYLGRSRLWVRGCSRHSRGADDKASPGTRATPAREGPKTGHHVMAGPEHTAARPRHGLLTVLQVKHLDRHHAHQRRSGQPTAGSTVNACTKLAPSLPAKPGPGPDPRPDPGQSASKPAVCQAWPTCPSAATSHAGSSQPRLRTCTRRSPRNPGQAALPVRALPYSQQSGILPLIPRPTEMGSQVTYR